MGINIGGTAPPATEHLLVCAEMALGLQLRWQVLAGLLLCLCAGRWAEAGKVLVVPMEGSHSLKHAGRPLMSSRPKATEQWLFLCR